MCEHMTSTTGAVWCANTFPCWST